MAEKDGGSRVLSAVKEDAITGGVAVGSAAAILMVPVVGTVIGLVGFGFLGLRAVRRGLKKK